ncbi:hypothetical protein GCK72_017739 [Caenorhabditis remanei]|uniref:Uncharacterized protein n=1 Tax=Caenorhabditis remanei TaxID=31234 RepID=A0A6A5G930_CAERE|nr:hypothetical protein GCK72_017739 [Caenorhabditis remanei]KAF1751185.1 hypothetical protein GCK72_017739 [Caenorhabditis remanei]
MKALTTSPPSQLNNETSPPRKRPAECEICLRAAKGHHCGVASCKGCKTFFRRMCVSNTEFKCKLNEDCFDLSKRTVIHLRCQACRYKKCIDVGMNPLALELKSEEENALNFKQLVKRTRDEEQQANLKICVLETRETNSKQVINMLSYLELKIEQFRISAYNPSFFEFGTFEEMILRQSRFGIADRLGPMPGWPLPRDKIVKEDILGKSGIRDVPDKPGHFSPNKKIWMLINTLTNIEYAKTFMFFHKLDFEDKAILISHVTLICMNLNNTYFAISKKIDECLQPDGTITPQNDEYNYPAFSMAFAPLIRCNVQPTEYVLLKAICLCNPTIHGLSEHAQSIIIPERQQYADVLFDYCVKHHGNGAPSRFAELLGIIPILEQQQQKQKHIHIYHIAPIIAKYDMVLGFLDDIMFS